MKKRIKADRLSLKKQGYKSIQVEKIHNYFNNSDKAVIIYSALKDKDTYMKYSMPKEFQLERLYNDHVKPLLKSEPKKLDMEYGKSGAVYSIIDQENVSHIYIVKPSLEVLHEEGDNIG